MDLGYLTNLGVPVYRQTGLALTKAGRGGVPAPKNGRTVVTRFAPSPTGYLHIGGARTALFCYLYAKHHGGEFKLRIEDTDLQRNDEKAVEAIVKGMKWLGTEHDGEIVRQSRNIIRHKEVAEQLIKIGKAYKCYSSKEELDALRAEAEAKKLPFRYPGTWRNPGNKQPPAGVEPVVRIKTPDDNGTTGWNDGVMGHIEIPNKDIDDFIILRADGTPTYLLAVVVDDHDMGVTNVMRGSDHIPNTPRQMAIYNNLGWELPNFAHLPLIHGPDGKKMSKRHGATGVEQYEALGYLPEAMRNYLARLSWSHGNDEIFTTQQAIEWFDLSSCSKAAPCFDFDKLNNLNQHYIKECDVNRLTDIFCKLFPGDIKGFEDVFRTPRVADMLKVRAKTLVEYRDAADFILMKRPVKVTKDAEKLMTSDAAKENLKLMAGLLKGFSGEWTPEALEPAVKAFIEEKKIKLGDFAKPARVALTGRKDSPSLFEVIWAIGKKECITRLEECAVGKYEIKEPAPTPPPVEDASPVVPTGASVPVSVPSNLSPGDADGQAKAVGEEIRALKAKLKADGLSGKKIDVNDDVKALVVKLQALKVAAAAPATQATAPAAPAAPASTADLDAQIKALGEEVRALKAKLKADGLSGKKADANEEVKAKVAKLQELKAAAAK